MKKIIGSLLFIILFLHVAFSQGPIKIGSGTISNINLKLKPPTTALNTQTTSAKLYVKFYVGNKAYEKINFTDMKLSFNLEATNKTVSIINQKADLTINGLEPEEWMVYDFSNTLPADNSFDYTINLTAFSLSNTNGATISPDDILMEAFVTTDYQTGVLIDGIKEALNISKPSQSSRLATFKWQSNNPYPAFQIQLVRLYNTDATNIANEAIKADVDWSKALSLEVYNNGNSVGEKSLALSIIEGSGYYAWRVRPLGNFGKGLTSDPRNLGAWSACPASIDVDLASAIAAEKAFFYFTDPEEDKNWSYTRVFSEKGKQKDIIQFATGLNYVQQTQTHLYSSNTTLITQAVVDYTGRTSVNTMPVPLGEQNLNTYKTDFFKNSDNQLYTAKDFDTDANFKNPSVNSETNAFSYYNGSNADLVPDAQQYAFSRVLYYNDGTGRVKEQTGVGQTHQLVADDNGHKYNKTTRFYYTSPTEAELVTLFGMEAPSSASVIKVTTVDPNGIASVEYKGKDGKLLATAIQQKLGANPVMDELQSPENSLSEGNNKITLSSKDGFVTSKRFVLTHHVDPFNITYNPPSKFWENVQLGSCVDGNCTYNLRIEIYDLDATANQLVWSRNEVINIDDKDKPISMTIDGGLADGEYLVVKSLTPATDGSNMGQKTANNMMGNIQPVINVIKYWLNNQVANGTWSLDVFYNKVKNIPTSIDPSLEYFFKDLIDKNATDPLLGISGIKDPNFKTKLGLGNISVINEPFKLSIGTKCDPIEILLEDPIPAYKCIKPAEITRTEAFYTNQFKHAYNPDLELGLFNFEEYMQKELSAAITSAGGLENFYTVYMPGYRPYKQGVQDGDFNRMIFHMIADEYAEIDGQTIIKQYTCDQVWPAWITSVNILKEALAGNGINNVANSVDTENGETPGSGSSLNDQFDKNFKPPFGGRFTKWIFKIVLSRKMRKFSNNNPVKSEIKMNLPYLFLNATGYKFARVFDTERAADNPIFDVLPADKVEYNDKRKSSTDLVLFSKDIPLVRTPVFAFKYYEYATYCKSCDDELNYGLTDLPGPDDCNPNINTIQLYATWDFTDREMFYQCIQNCPPMPTEDEKSTDPPDKCGNYDRPYFIATITALNNECISAIANRETEIYNKIQDLLISKGYTIGGCEGDPNIITPDFIQEMTDNSIIRLQNSTCTLLEPTLDGHCTEKSNCENAYLIIDLNPDRPGGNPNAVEQMYKIMYGEIHLDFNLPPAQCPVVDHVLHVQNGKVLNP